MVRPVLVVDSPFWQRNRARAVKLVRQAQYVISFKNVRFYVPFFPTDGIQRTQVMSGAFYENQILDRLSYCVPFGAIVFDVGSNIGNHAIYWGIKRRAQKVYAFEPVLSTFSILKTNIALNQAEATIIPINCALSDSIENLSIGKSDLQNSGGTHMKKDEKGGIMAITLDSFSFPEQKVDFMKIDVEGFECNVLQGGMRFLGKYHPAFIFIEIFPAPYLILITRILANLGYRFIEELPEKNYLWHFDRLPTQS
jgi:FkbM family methyltransferase